mgnify:FL=1
MARRTATRKEATGTRNRRAAITGKNRGGKGAKKRLGAADVQAGVSARKRGVKVGSRAKSTQEHPARAGHGLRSRSNKPKNTSGARRKRRISL